MTEQELDERISDMIDNNYAEMAERLENESITKQIEKAVRDFER